MKMKRISHDKLEIIDQKDMKPGDICFVVDDEEIPVGIVLDGVEHQQVTPAMLLVHDVLTTSLTPPSELDVSNEFEVGILPYQDRYYKLFVKVKDNKVLLSIPQLTNKSYELKTAFNKNEVPAKIVSELINNKIISSNTFINFAIIVENLID